ncbi:ABC transporter [Hypoxylon trugodes]|uniref:ABC transporter n=1 Tax=Hypoxylon trugodes TaxID=326681 RepID=UPI00219F57AD|nr:ABC transporter [Hypoxylon trugodes]KAI1383398.1 ABC transporter [Hypoxylon trugodes]
MARIASSVDTIANFSIVLSSLFICLSSLRIWFLRRAPPAVISGFQGWAKTVFSILLALSSLGRLATVENSTINGGDLHVASQALEFVAALNLCALSWIEHHRSFYPSHLIILYLIASLIRDGAEIPWSFLGSHDRLVDDPVLARVVLEVALLATESLQKTYIEGSLYEGVSLEERSSVLDRVFFWWINPVLLEGYRNVLLNSDLPSIDSKLLSKPVRVAALRAWDQRARPETSMTLPKVLLACLKKPFSLAIPARLFLTFFRYSQPIIIRQAIVYVTGTALRDQTWTGHGLVITAIVIYVGLAISTTIYRHSLNRLRTMIRASLIALIHDKTMNSYADTLSEGKVLTLASTDVDALDTIGEMFHETWGQVLEVVIGIVMLTWEVGWLAPVPLFIIFLCSRMSQYVAKNLRSRMGSWNDATQARISMTSATVGAIKNIKMLGLQDAISARIEQLRQNELHTASGVRWMMVAYNASANANGMFAPVITLVLYAILAKLKDGGLDTETAFTTIAILSMVTHPANMVMTIIPRVIASFSSFERIQSFLLQPSRRDYRAELARSKATSESETGNGDVDNSHRAIHIENLSVGETRHSLDEMNLNVRQGSFVICSGATATGKTIFARSILSEISSVGMVAVSSKRIGYCSQIPWLPNDSIKQVIVGFNNDSDVTGQEWYATVVNACCLTQDIDALPSGDETLVGSKGINLSGGQRQRLALARAVFARTDILILDDPFSALDGRTEKHIVKNLFGAEGLLKRLGTTVFLISNSTEYFHLSDEIIVLEHGHIKERGRWDELTSRDPEVSKIILSEDGARESKAAVPDTANPLFGQGRNGDILADSKRKTGDSALYNYYINAAGVVNFAFLLICNASCSFFVTFPQYWLKMWTDSKSNDEWIYIGGYIALALISWFSTNGIMWSTVIRVAPHSGFALHSKLLKTITCAPLLYFSRTDNGSILNRFSQDLVLVDRKLPSAVASMGTQVFKLLTQLILLFVAQKFLTVTLPICFAIVYIVQKIYLRTSRQLRLLELESKSAVLIDFLETVDGLTTIRAFAGQLKAEAEHLRSLDESQKPFYLLLCLQCWLRIVLDLLVVGIAVGVIALAVALRNTTTGGQVGVALNIVLIANTTLLRLVESWTDLEISLGAVSRIKSLEEEVHGEDLPSEVNATPEAWPSSGSIEFWDVTASYNIENTALENISLRIEPGQKVVICGRTGSGKSSLLLTLLRLLDIKSGSIIVDDINIGLVPRSIVREHCFVTVPQEPLLFNQETLRFNVDPTETLSNDTIIEILSKVHLWHHFIHIIDQKELHDVDIGTHPILDRTLVSLPPLSVGQGQLLALARALLQVYALSNLGSKPIILLDEATSSLDSRTEELILDIVHKELTGKGHTVVMVAHRVGAAVSHLRKGLDIVIWMKDGKIEKVGELSDVMGQTEQATANRISEEEETSDER